MNFKVTVIIMASIMIIGPLGLQVASGQEYTETQEFKAEFTPGDNYENTRTQNLGNASDLESNKDIWKKDMGEDMPEGVYRGHLFPPSKMELNYEPRWRNEFNHDSDQSDGEYGWTNFVQKVKVGSDKIMNGASEFWMQVPVDASCLKAYDTATTVYTEDVGGNVESTVYKSKIFSSIQIYKGDVEDPYTTMNNSRIAQSGYAYKEGEKVQPEMVVPIKPQDYYNNRPYVQIKGFFDSDQEYTVVYNLITGDERPKVYVTPADNFSTVNISYQKEYVNSTHVYWNNYAKILSTNDNWGQYTPYPDKTHMIMNQRKSTDIHLATSFIFTSGIGDNYLFGERVEVEAGDKIQFYPDMDYSTPNLNQSFYLPFISEDGLGGENGTSIDIGMANRYVNFENGESYSIYNDIEWTYNDFILFTNPSELSSIDIDGGDYVNSRTIIQIEFNEPTELTFLMSAKEPEYTFKDQNISDNTALECRWHGSMMSVNNLTYGESETFDNRYENYFYYPYVVGQLTDGVWAKVDSNSEGQESYSHAFGVHEYYSNITMRMVDEQNNTVILNINSASDKSDEDSGWVEKIGETVEGGAEYAYNFVFPNSADDNHLFQNIRSAMTDVASFLWEGTQKIFGKIWDGLIWIWEGIKEVFNILYNAIMEFVDWLKGTIEDVMNVLGVLFERVAYIAGLLAFVGLTAATSKLTNLSYGNYKKGGKFNE